MTWRNCWPNGGITVDHVTIYRWVQRFTTLLIDAARPCRRWFVDETYLLSATSPSRMRITPSKPITGS